MQLSLFFLSSSSVMVRLKNEGSDTYEHDVYGDSIMVERRIKLDGSGGYTIKSCSGIYCFAFIAIKIIEIIFCPKI